MLVPPITGLHIGNLTNVAQGTQPVHFFGYHFYNPNAGATAFIQIFNKSSSDVVVGVTTPDYVIPVPGSAAGSPGVAQIQWVRPLLFNLSISIAATTTPTGGIALGSPCDAILFVDKE